MTEQQHQIIKQLEDRVCSDVYGFLKQGAYYVAYKRHIGALGSDNREDWSKETQETADLLWQLAADDPARVKISRPFQYEES